jgi:hypothetical protein
MFCPPEAAELLSNRAKTDNQSLTTARRLQRRRNRRKTKKKKKRKRRRRRRRERRERKATEKQRRSRTGMRTTQEALDAWRSKRCGCRALPGCMSQTSRFPSILLLPGSWSSALHGAVVAPLHACSCMGCPCMYAFLFGYPVISPPATHSAHTSDANAAAFGWPCPCCHSLTTSSICLL